MPLGLYGLAILLEPEGIMRVDREVNYITISISPGGRSKV